MSDPKAPETNSSVDAIGKAITYQLPGIIKAYNSQIVPTEQAKVDASRVVSPQYSQLLSDLYKTYAPQLAQAGTNVDTQNRTANANTTANILGDQGAKTAAAYTSIEQQNNPEYYKTRALEGNKLSELLSSINLNNPNPEAERLINQENSRSGQLGNSSNTNTVANALNFGSAKAQRQSTLSNAISTATQFLQPSNNQAAQVAYGASAAPSTTNAAGNAISQFSGVTPTGQTTYDTGNNVLGAASSAQNTAMGINANRRDVIDRLNSTISPSAMPSC